MRICLCSGYRVEWVEALGSMTLLHPLSSRMLDSVAMLRLMAHSQRLCGSLNVYFSTLHELLGWTPPLSVDAALRVTAQHFIEQRK